MTISASIRFTSKEITNDASYLHPDQPSSNFLMINSRSLVFAGILYRPSVCKPVKRKNQLVLGQQIHLVREKSYGHLMTQFLTHTTGNVFITKLGLQCGVLAEERSEEVSRIPNGKLPKSLPLLSM